MTEIAEKIFHEPTMRGIKYGDYDPSALGTNAPIDEIFIQAGGIPWIKTGAGFTAWTRIATGAGGGGGSYLPLSGGSLDAGASLTVPGTLTGSVANFSGHVTLAHAAALRLTRTTGGAVVDGIRYDSGTDDLSIVLGGSILRFRDTGAGVPMSLTASGILTLAVALRVPGNGASAIQARNAANSAWVDLLYLGTGDQAVIPRKLQLTEALRIPGAGAAGIQALNNAATAWVDLLYLDTLDRAAIPRNLTVSAAIAAGGQINAGSFLQAATYVKAGTYFEDGSGNRLYATILSSGTPGGTPQHGTVWFQIA